MFFCHNKSASAGLSAAETISQTARPPPLPAPLCHSHPFSTHGWEWWPHGFPTSLLVSWACATPWTPPVPHTLTAAYLALLVFHAQFLTPASVQRRSSMVVFPHNRSSLQRFGIR